ncbi:ABC transporter substrate-binding protein [Clostridium rectalis]|uniref:ABC transporter substrate-binding protein n=1 Tax=Clostridium rectalis TaxID=2040295 RepID=UPI000F635220|nr:ABC transporter substrate-binding protein [Clostridium rectalis]
MKRLKSLFLIILLIGIIFTACDNKGRNKKDSLSQLEDIDLVLDWYPNAIHSFIYTAMEKGYFQEQGLNVNIKFPSNATDPIALVAANKATVGIYYQPDVVMSRSNEKVPIKSIGAIVHKPLNVIISLKEKNINSPKDLSGKTVGYSGNPLNTEYVKTMVQADGGDASSVKVIDVGFELLSSMITKKVDATTGGLINHEIPVLKHEGHSINYFNPSKYGVPNYYEEIFVTSDETLKQKSETLKKFMKGCKKGFEFMKKTPDESLNILLKNQQKDSFPLTKEVEKESMNMLLPKMESAEEPFLYQDRKVWQQNINWLYKKGLLNKKMNADDFFVNLDEI